MQIGEGKYFVATATYNNVLKPGAITEISLSQIALDPSATNEDVAGFGETYQVLVQSQAVQAAGFQDGANEQANAKFALDESFGEISTMDLPWDTDLPVKGIDLRTAVTYMNGDATDKKITATVTDIVFGLTGDHTDIAEEYDGVLVDVEQDVPVYAYYVGNAVYFLANDDIYLPKDSGRLFQDMAALVSVDTSNLNTSRAELMNHLFFGCSALKNLDISGFDTGKATTLKSMFNLCSALENVDVSKWDTRNVTDTSYMFYKSGMIDLDLRGLDMGNVQNTMAMFGNTSKLKKLDATGWDLTGLTNATAMFVNSTAITEIVGSGNWYMPNVVTVDSMIQNCDSLVSIDVTNWDLSSAENMYSMFWSCAVLETIEGCENWNTGSVTSTKAMFEASHSLKDVDVSTWDTSSVKDMSHMFRAHGIEELDVSNWDVSNVEYFNSMFSASSSNTGAISLKKLDVSKWNPESAVKMNNMFHGCGKITELDVSGWNMPNLLTTSHMFSDCFALTSIDFTGWYTPSLTSMDGMFNDCRAIQVLDVSEFETSNCVEFSQVFEACHSLQYIIGLDKWDTSKGIAFDEMFNQAWSLKEVDLSSFNTRSAKSYGVMQNGGIYYGFSAMFSGAGSLQKLTLGADFDFNGDGSITTTSGSLPSLPNPAPIDGQPTVWYNAANDTYYTASEIPEETAATYIAVVKPADNG